MDRPDYQTDIVPFIAGDGLPLNLIHVVADKPVTKGPILLVHGAGVRADIFCAPVSKTIVDVLLDAGYDVWLENWRGSIDISPNEWTLDEVALYDHPKAVEKIIELTQAEKIKAIIHCQGSTSFMMSAIAGLVPQVDVVVSSAVSLHPIVPWWSAIKLRFAVPFVGAFIKYLNPFWGERTEGWMSRCILALVKISHHECDNNVCKMVSFTYGAGMPALWLHENLNEETHDWLKHEFKEVPLSFFRQIAKSVRQGNLVAINSNPKMPDDYIAITPKTNARFVFITGAENRCFLPDSQRKTYAYFNQLEEHKHKLHVFPNYSHLDVFMGKNAAQDIFPTIISELDS